MPDLTPIDFALFTRAMPAASFGAGQPVVRRRDRRRADGGPITSYPELDVSVPCDRNATAAEVTERVRVAMDD